MANWYEEQLTNRNFLSPIGFLFTLEKAKKASFLCQAASIPTLSLGDVNIPTRGMVPIPTEGNLVYGGFEIEFIVDEDLRNYMEIHNWMRGISGGNHTWERGDYEEHYTPRCDGSLAVMNSNMQTNFFVNFKDLFPVSLNALEFNATIDGTEYATASVEFRYTSYDIVDKEGVRRTTLE